MDIVKRQFNRISKAMVAKREYQILAKDVKRNVLKIIDLETAEIVYTFIPIIGAAAYFTIGNTITFNKKVREVYTSYERNVRREAKDENL